MVAKKNMKTAGSSIVKLILCRDLKCSSELDHNRTWRQLKNVTRKIPRWQRIVHADILILLFRRTAKRFRLDRKIVHDDTYPYNMLVMNKSTIRAVFIGNVEFVISSKRFAGEEAGEGRERMGADASGHWENGRIMIYH